MVIPAFFVWRSEGRCTDGFGRSPHEEESQTNGDRRQRSHGSQLLRGPDQVVVALEGAGRGSHRDPSCGDSLRLIGWPANGTGRLVTRDGLSPDDIPDVYRDL